MGWRVRQPIFEQAYLDIDSRGAQIGFSVSLSGECQFRVMVPRCFGAICWPIHTSGACGLPWDNNNSQFRADAMPSLWLAGADDLKHRCYLPRSLSSASEARCAARLGPGWAFFRCHHVPARPARFASTSVP